VEKDTVAKRLIQSHCEMRHKGSLILSVLSMKALDGFILLVEESKTFNIPNCCAYIIFGHQDTL